MEHRTGGITEAVMCIHAHDVARISAILRPKAFGTLISPKARLQRMFLQLDYFLIDSPLIDWKVDLKVFYVKL
jgi:hypothetical protein